MSLEIINAFIPAYDQHLNLTIPARYVEYIIGKFLKYASSLFITFQLCFLLLISWSEERFIRLWYRCLYCVSKRVLPGQILMDGALHKIRIHG
jgi:hypothetical protein